MSLRYIVKDLKEIRENNKNLGLFAEPIDEKHDMYHWIGLY